MAMLGQTRLIHPAVACAMKETSNMDNSNRSASESALNRAQELLSRDPQTWRPALYRRIRWWNLALGVVIIIGAAAVIAPLKNPAYREGFSGNLVSSAWQLIAGGAVAWIVFRRFKAERFKRAMPITWADAFKEMERISLDLYPMAIADSAADLRNALNAEVRRRLRQAAARAHQKGVLFGRFFEVEQLADIDRSCDAAESLSGIDDRLPDPKFMQTAIDTIRDLHVYPTSVRGLSPSLDIFNSLEEAYMKWENVALKQDSANTA
jgi:hypothetical protein